MVTEYHLNQALREINKALEQPVAVEQIPGGYKLAPGSTIILSALGSAKSVIEEILAEPREPLIDFGQMGYFEETAPNGAPVPGMAFQTDLTYGADTYSELTVEEQMERIARDLANHPPGKTVSFTPDWDPQKVAEIIRRAGELHDQRKAQVDGSVLP